MPFQTLNQKLYFMAELNLNLPCGCEPETVPLKQTEPLSMFDGLKAKRDRLLQQVNDIEALMKTLEENPKILQTFDLLRRVNRY